MEKPDLLKPALISGVIFGVASALPIIGFFNCLCCALVFACGIFAAFLLMRQHPGVITYGNGAAVGFLAGVFGVFTYTIIDALVQLTMGRYMKDMLLEMFDNIKSSVPPELVSNFDLLEQELLRDFTIVDMIKTFILWLILFGAFSTLGGILGVALFGKRKRQQPQTYFENEKPL